MFVLRDPAVGIHGGTSVPLWGTHPGINPGKVHWGYWMLQELCEWGREGPPQAPEVASSLLEKWEKALQHMIRLWMRRDVLDMVG